MDKYNKSLYSDISDKMSGINSRYAHDENMESGMVASLKDWRSECYENYIRSLLNPESHKAKIPGPLPVDSATASLRYNFSITPNSTGKFLLVIDPFSQTGFLYQDAGLNGTGGGTVTNLTFAQDSTLVDNFRVVSASVTLKYFGSFNNMSGVFVGANTNNYSAATQTTFLNFSIIEGLPQKRVCRASEGVKFIYSPLDENSNEFQPQTMYSAGTHPCKWQNLFVVYGDLFPNTSSIRVDYCRNIEYQSTNTYKQYIDHSKIQSVPAILPKIPSVVPATDSGLSATVGQVLKDVIGETLGNINPDAINKGMNANWSMFGRLPKNY